LAEIGRLLSIAIGRSWPAADFGMPQTGQTALAASSARQLSGGKYVRAWTGQFNKENRLKAIYENFIQ
jgi:hypothetical protein